MTMISTTYTDHTTEYLDSESTTVESNPDTTASAARNAGTVSPKFQVGESRFVRSNPSSSGPRRREVPTGSTSRTSDSKQLSHLGKLRKSMRNIVKTSENNVDDSHNDEYLEVQGGGSKTESADRRPKNPRKERSMRMGMTMVKKVMKSKRSVLEDEESDPIQRGKLERKPSSDSTPMRPLRQGSLWMRSMKKLVESEPATEEQETNDAHSDASSICEKREAAAADCKPTHPGRDRGMMMGALGRSRRGLTTMTNKIMKSKRNIAEDIDDIDHETGVLRRNTKSESAPANNRTKAQSRMAQLMSGGGSKYGSSRQQPTKRLSRYNPSSSARAA